MQGACKNVGRKMTGTVELLVRHSYSFLFAWVLAEQLGLPLPSAPLLLAAGALAGTHRINLEMAIALPIVTVMICDFFWYQLGRLKGMKVLQWLCRVSLEPDTCVRRAQAGFERNGPWELAVARFVPGMNVVAVPLAGIIRMPLLRFALFDGLGATLWAVGYIGTGYVFSNELEDVASHLAAIGRGLFAVLLAGLMLYIGWKYFNRRRFLRKLRIARISPEELRQRMIAGEDIVVVDLRHALEFESEPETIPGAVHMDPLKLEQAFELIPRDREIVLFCSCPNEATAAQSALRLRNLGITRIRPLAGGLAGWRGCGYPVKTLALGEASLDILSPAPGR
jgi:membrane protein DedA with SNARE-associated domain/rhodanese-related sulfurtransferase